MQIIQKFKNHAFFFLIAVFIIHRITFLLFAHPFHLFVFRFEELYRGAMAQILAQSTWADFYHFRPDDYAGGSFIIGVLANVVFKLLGANAFSLKLVSVTWSALAFLFWFRAVERWEDRRTALLFAFFFLLCPPAFLRYTLAPLGDHAETVLFSGFSFYLLHRVIYQPNLLSFISLGLISGFGVWFSYTHAICVATLLIFWKIYQPGLFKTRAVALFIFFLLIGFSPWIITNLVSQGGGMIVQGKPLWEILIPINFLKKMINFRSSSLYQWFSSFEIYGPPYTPQRFTLWIYRLLLIMPFAAAIFASIKEFKKNGRIYHPLLLAGTLYTFLFCLVAQFTEYSALRYFIPSHPFLYLGAAIGFQQLLIRNHKKIFLVAILFYLAITLFIQGRLLSWDHRGYLLKQSGSSYAWLTGSPVCSNANSCLEGFNKLWPQYSVEDKQSLSMDLSLAIASELPFKKLPAELDAVEMNLPNNLLGTFYFFLGYEIFARCNENLEESLQLIELAISNRPKRLYLLCILGTLDAAMNRFSTVKAEEMVRLENKIPIFARDEYWRKLGFEWCQLYLYDFSLKSPFHDYLGEFIGRLPARTHTFFYQGLGHALFGHCRLNQQHQRITRQSYLSLSHEIRLAIAQGAGLASSKVPAWDQFIYRELFFKLTGTEFKKDFDEYFNQREILWNELGFSF